MRKKVGVETVRRENGETKENHIDAPQTALDIKAADNSVEEEAAPLNGNHVESDENSEEGEREADVENQPNDQSSTSPNPELPAASDTREDGGEMCEPADMSLNPPEEEVSSGDGKDREEEEQETSADKEGGEQPTEPTDISNDTPEVSKAEPESRLSPNPECPTEQAEEAEHDQTTRSPFPRDQPSDEEERPIEDREDEEQSRDLDSPRPDPEETEEQEVDREESVGEDVEPPQQPVRPHGHGGLEPRPDMSPDPEHELQEQQPQNLHQSPHHQPQNLHQSPAQMSPANMHQSPAYSGPLNLHQSPAHPGPSPTLSEHSPHPFQRPSPYHPPPDSGPHNPHLQYSMSSQYPAAAAYNHHYFNNANNNYNGQHGFMSSPHGFPPNFGASEGSGGHRPPSMAEHEMYPHQSRAHDSHHSSHLGHPALGQFPGRQGPDPYSFSGASDEDGCSPNRGGGPPFNPMGFHGMPMPLIAPKAKKPRKPRKPKSPRPLPDPTVLAMQMQREDSRSGDFSDMSFDDDGDGDGKLVIAEGDDLDIKMEGLGEDGKKEKKPRRKHNRFNGMSEEEVMKRLLPDLICPDLDILIVGINPGLYAAFKQHHYAGPGNHFWKCLFLSGLIPRPMNADNDRELIGLGIGFTNIVERTTRASQELTRQEIEEGAKKLIAKIKEFNPKIAVFNGKGIYEVFSGQKEFIFGKQPEKIRDTETYAWVMPNSSARCAQLPRAVDKVPFYAALKKFRDYLRGDIQELDESDVVFPEVKLQNFNNKRIKKEEFGDEMNSETMDGDDRIDPLTGKKRRGRPPKPRPDGTLPAPKRRRVDEFGNPLPKGSNPIDPVTGKKKRGRPKKSDMPQPTALGPQGALPTTGQPPLGLPNLPNGLQSLALKAKAAEVFQSEEATESENASGKTPTRLPPFSPHFNRGLPGGIKEEENEEGEEGARLHSSIGSEEGQSQGLPKDLSRADSLPDLSGRLGDDPCSPPPSPMGKSLPPPEFEPPRSLHEEETSHSTEDRRPDSARSLTRPQVPCNFSAPTTPVDHSPHQGYPPQHQRFSPFPRGAPHHSPNYPQGHPQQQGPPQNFHAPYRGTPHLQGTPPHQNYDSPQPQPQHPPKSHHPSDLSTKSLTGLESLVDQIPAIAEADSGVFSSSGNGSHPATPRSVGPYSPGQYHGGGSYLPPSYSGPGYGPGSQQAAPGSGTPGSDSFPTDLSTSTNYGHPVASTTASHSPSTPSNFSVSHLAHSSVRGNGAEENGEATITGHGAAPPMTEAFSVSSLTSSYASPVSSHGGGGPEEPPKYPPGISSNPYMSGHASSMFSPSLMTRSIGPPSGSFPSMGGMAGMAGMGAFAGMAGYGAMSNYGQYSAASAAAGAYTGAAQAFAAAAGGGTYHHGLPMPNPSYPYPSPYSQSPYSQSPYF